MRFSISQAQIQFFRDRLFIEFEDLISPQQVALIKEETISNCVSHPYKEAYLLNHDLYRKKPTLRKIITSPLFASIVSNLTNKNHIRLAFDQLLFSVPPYENRDLIPSMFSGRYNLEQISCVQGLLCGLIINIDAVAPLPNLPSKIGNIVYFSSLWPIDFHELSIIPNQKYLIIGYAKEQAIYRHQPLDPATHELKKLGYVFGDTLVHEHHPIFLF
ncbi:MAG: hypothetical protein HY860_02395 [Chlamydiales bacterium]|nr:hypothetical protein [Chlamydiales bacterium]